MKKVLSFDVGIINLAYCVLEIDDNLKKFRIIDWGVIDLATNRHTCAHETKKGLCGKIATRCVRFSKLSAAYYCSAHIDKQTWTPVPINICWNDATNSAIQCSEKISEPSKCSKDKKKYTYTIIRSGPEHVPTDTRPSSTYCAAHKKHFMKTNNYQCVETKCVNAITRMFNVGGIECVGWCDTHHTEEAVNRYIEIKTKKISQNSNKTSLVDLGKIMYERLDGMRNLLAVDQVLIENQPSFINPTMKTISAILFSYFLMRGIHEKSITRSSITDVLFCSPSNKIKVDKKIASHALEDAGEKVYKITKKIGVQFCMALIADDPQYVSILNAHKKKDDMADAFLQAFVLNFGPTLPAHYATKIKNIKMEEVKKKHSQTAIVSQEFVPTEFVPAIASV